MLRFGLLLIPLAVIGGLYYLFAHIGRWSPVAAVVLGVILVAWIIRPYTWGKRKF